MTQDLSSLIERVEKCTGADREIDAAVAKTFGEPHGPHEEVHYESRSISVYDEIAKRYTASLDAVVALIQREAPKTEWLVSGGTITMAATSKSHASGATPALALLLAFLRAKSTSPSPPQDWIERCAAIADSYAGKPVESPRDFEAWAKHGERMSALRIANKIRALLPTPPKEDYE